MVNLPIRDERDVSCLIRSASNNMVYAVIPLYARLASSACANPLASSPSVR